MRSCFGVVWVLIVDMDLILEVGLGDLGDGIIVSMNFMELNLDVEKKNVDCVDRGIGRIVVEYV